MYNKMLKFRDKFLVFYKRYEYLINFFVKFLLGLFIFYKIISIDMFADKLLILSNVNISWALGVILGLLFYFMPLSISYLLITFLLCAALSSALEIAMLVFVGLILILLFYARIATKESIFILLTILGFYFKIPFAVPLIAGLYFGVTTIFPVGIGILIWFSKDFILTTTKSAAVGITNMSDLASVPKALFEVYKKYITYMSTNQNWIFYILIFSMVIIFVYFISKFDFDFSKEIAVVLGAMLNIIGFLISSVVSNANISVVSVIFSTVISAVIVLIIKFFDNVLDYPNAEKVEFEDDNYYYFVKAIPKINSEQVLPEKKISKASTKKENLVRTKEELKTEEKEKADEKAKLDKKEKTGKKARSNKKVRTKTETNKAKSTDKPVTKTVKEPGNKKIKNDVKNKK